MQNYAILIMKDRLLTKKERAIKHLTALVIILLIIYCTFFTFSAGLRGSLLICLYMRLFL